MSDDLPPSENLPHRAGSKHAGSNLTRLRELAELFLKLGVVSFGGPAAHIAMMEHEVVNKRQWVTRQQFLDMVGAANLIPGPTSTELSINTGFVRAGWAGLVVAGACFILPAAMITGAFAWVYVRFGTLPQAASVLGGIKPAVIAVIAIAIWRLGKSAVKDFSLAILAGTSLGVFFLGFNPITILFAGGVVGMVARRAGSLRTVATGVLAVGFPRWPMGSRMLDRLGSFLFPTLGVFATTSSANVDRPSLTRLALFFLKVGALLYGGGYVLLAFLEQGLVRQHAWLTQQQLLDAVAIGQFTPGPLLSTATFIGYVLGGAPGAAVATLAIFLPSFFYVALLAPLLFRLRQSAWMAAFLDSVNACAIALMAGATYRLAVDAMRAWSSWLIAVAALAILLRWKVNSAWVILGGGAVGLALAALR